MSTKVGRSRGPGHCPVEGYGVDDVNKEPKPPGLSSRTVNQARGLRETDFQAPEKQRAGLQTGVCVPEASPCEAPPGISLDASLSVSCPQNTLRCPDGCRGVAGGRLPAAAFCQPEQSCIWLYLLPRPASRDLLVACLLVLT